jgi:hypothetical protein
VAIEVAFPLGEEIGDYGMEIARQNPRPDVREEPTAHTSIDQRRGPATGIWICGVARILFWLAVDNLGVLREDRLGEPLRLSDWLKRLPGLRLLVDQ